MKRLNIPVEMISVFHADCTYPKPVKFKHKLENGKVITVNVDKILNEKHRKWGEIITVEYECDSRVMTAGSLWSSQETDLNGSSSEYKRRQRDET